MVGVPALEKCVCGPSLRIGWPPLSWASLRITAGPTTATGPARSAREDAAEGEVAEQAGQALQLSSRGQLDSMRCFASCGSTRLDDPVHRAAARTLHQYAHAVAQSAVSAGEPACRGCRTRVPPRRTARAAARSAASAYRRRMPRLRAPAFVVHCCASAPSSRMSPSTSQAFAARPAGPACRSRRAASRGWRCSCRRSAPRREAMLIRRPATGCAAPRPSRIAASTPRPSAARGGERVADVVRPAARARWPLALRRDQGEREPVAAWAPSRAVTSALASRPKRISAGRARARRKTARRRRRR